MRLSAKEQIRIYYINFPSFCQQIFSQIIAFCFKKFSHITQNVPDLSIGLVTESDFVRISADNDLDFFSESTVFVNYVFCILGIKDEATCGFIRVDRDIKISLDYRTVCANDERLTMLYGLAKPRLEIAVGLPG